jgi:hypothetical protein
MRVISTTGTRTISVVLRDYSENEQYSIFIVNESTREAILLSRTKTIAEIQANEDNFEFEITNEFLEGDELSLYILQPNTTKYLHRNKILVTDKQTQNWNE